MSPHHAPAISMSKIAAQRTVLPQVKDLAARIQAAQHPKSINRGDSCAPGTPPVPSTNGPKGGTGQGDMVVQIHGANGAMPGMMSGGQMHQLGHASGDAFDRMFLQMRLVGAGLPR
jgi:uncharacterized protein (DUF305 family)